MADKTGVAPVRVRKQIAGFFAPEVGKQLRLLAAEGSTTVQALLTEALNDLFAKRGCPQSMVRLIIIDVPPDLHARVMKAEWAMSGLKLADVLRNLLEREFPKSRSTAGDAR